MKVYDNCNVIIDKINPFLFQKIKKEVLALDAVTNTKHDLRSKDMLVNFQRSMHSDIPFNSLTKDTNEQFKQEVVKFVNTHEAKFDLFNMMYNFTTNKDVSKVKWNFENIWINIQQAGDFVPFHQHSGMYSFVLWVQIPYSLSHNKKMKIDRTDDHRVGTFNFVYPNSLGRLTTQTIDADNTMEGEMAIFPAELHHMVYPFYDCDDLRITISGNLNIDTKSG